MLFPPRGPVAFIPHVRARVCVRAITKGGREVGAGGERERERGREADGIIDNEGGDQWT